MQVPDFIAASAATHARTFQVVSSQHAVTCCAPACLPPPQGVIDDCQLGALLPRQWLGRVDGVLPGSGYRVSWDGLWADFVVGVSLENLVHGGTPRLAPALLLDVLQQKLNSSQVRVRVAPAACVLFDACLREQLNPQ